MQMQDKVEGVHARHAERIDWLTQITSCIPFPVDTKQMHRPTLRNYEVTMISSVNIYVAGYLSMKRHVYETLLVGFAYKFYTGSLNLIDPLYFGRLNNKT